VTPLALRWTRAVPSLRETGLRAAFMKSEMRRHDLGVVAAAIDQLAGLAEQADPIAREVLAAIVLALADGSLASRAEALRARAATNALLPLARLLRRKPQREGVGASQPPEPDERALPQPPAGGRALTLGERKSLARRSSRVALDRLLRDPHPHVIRNVLVNPRLTEDDVVRLAARRPAYPDVLVEIARHADWSQRARVRRALVQNPFTPADVAVPLVRLLIRPELVEVMSAPAVPAIVRAAAKELLERRPPVPERRSERDSDRAPGTRSH
jgi:hypothetical protein